MIVAAREQLPALPLYRMCQLLGLSRSLAYRPLADKEPEQAQEAALVSAIDQIVLRFPGYGYRRVTAQLARDGYAVNHKRGAAPDAGARAFVPPETAVGQDHRQRARSQNLSESAPRQESQRLVQAKSSLGVRHHLRSPGRRQWLLLCGGGTGCLQPPRHWLAYQPRHRRGSGLDRAGEGAGNAAPRTGAVDSPLRPGRTICLPRLCRAVDSGGRADQHEPQRGDRETTRRPRVSSEPSRSRRYIYRNTATLPTPAPASRSSSTICTTTSDCTPPSATSRPSSSSSNGRKRKTEKHKQNQKRSQKRQTIQRSDNRDVSVRRHGFTSIDIR